MHKKFKHKNKLKKPLLILKETSGSNWLNTEDASEYWRQNFPPSICFDSELTLRDDSFELIGLSVVVEIPCFLFILR